MNAGFPASQEQIQAELEQIKPHLEELTELSSRWNGSVVLVSGALFKGLKPYHCDIRIGDRFLEPEERWTTLLHELLHSLSTGYNRVDFEANVGWEEGVVEKMQRLLRTEVFTRLGVNVRRDLLMQLDTGHSFNRYIESLEKIRLTTDADELAFYLNLLQTPLKGRYSSLLAQTMRRTDPQRTETLRVLSSANVSFCQGRREGI